MFSEINALANRLSMSTLLARAYYLGSRPKTRWGQGDRKTWGWGEPRVEVGVRWDGSQPKARLRTSGDQQWVEKRVSQA